MKKLTTAILLCFLVIVFMSGCVEEREVKIGVITPLTGSAAKYGSRAKWGIDLAEKHIKSSSDASPKIKLIYEDSKTDPKEAVNALQKLIIVDKVGVVIGAVTSSEFLAMTPIAEKNHVVLLTPSASSPKITEAGDYIFRNTYSDFYEGKKMADYIFNETQHRNVAVLYINNDYGVGLRDAFKQEFEKLGGKVVLENTYDSDEKDFRIHLAKLKRVNAQVLYLVGYAEMGYILKQAKELKILLPTFSCIMFEDANIIKIARNTTDGVIYAYPAYFPESEENIVRKFVNDYKEEYGEEPNIYAATSYDALKILYLAMKKGDVTSEKIKTALYSIRSYPAVTGETSFDVNGDCVKSIGIKKVENGLFKWIHYKY